MSGNPVLGDQLLERAFLVPVLDDLAKRLEALVAELRHVPHGGSRFSGERGKEFHTRAVHPMRSCFAAAGVAGEAVWGAGAGADMRHRRRAEPGEHGLR